MPANIKNNLLIYEGCNYLRYRLILSTLSGKPVRIINIRPNSDDPGLREYEISFIRLLDKITNGSRVELNETGTNLYFNPGILIGGEKTHECSLERGIGYYLVGVMALAPFCKKMLKLCLKGITNNVEDPSVDRIKTAAVPILQKFLDDNQKPSQKVILNINKRGLAPLGGGEVYFQFPNIKCLKSIQFQDSGMVKRIRGMSCSLRVSPAISNRLVESAKGVLLKFLPDIYIHTDSNRGASNGKSPGFGISITAETTTGVFFSGEAFSSLTNADSLPSIPEDLGKEAAMKLLDEIYRNGCVDSPFQSMAVLFMSLGKDVSKMAFGPLTPATVQFLRDLRDFFGISFKLDTLKNEGDTISEQNQILLTCVGIGYSNLSRPIL